MRNLRHKRNFTGMTAIILILLLLLQTIPIFAEDVLPGEYYAVVESIDFSSYGSVDEIPALNLNSNAYTRAVISENSLQVQQLQSQVLNSAGTAANTASHDVFTKSFEENYSGKYMLSIDYEANVETIGSVEANGTTVSVPNPYYTIRLLDNLYIRVYNSSITVLNSSSVADNTMSVTNITTSTAANTINIIFDSDTSQVEVYLNDNTDVKSVGTVSGTSLSSFKVRAMQRMTTSTYLNINSYQIKYINGFDAFDMENAEIYSGDLFSVSYDESTRSITVTQIDSIPLKNGVCNTTTFSALKETISKKEGIYSYSGLKGRFQIDLVYDLDIDYPSAVDGVNITAPYYRMDFEGFGHLRFYNNRVSVFNASASADNTMSVTNLYTDKQTQNRVRIILDTISGTFTVSLNSDTNISTGNAQNTDVSEIRTLKLNGMERMSAGSYFTLTGYNLECIEDVGIYATNTHIYQPTDDSVFYYTQPRDENGDYDYFGYELYGDPMDISDSDFFGAWNSTTETWDKLPYLNYSDYTGLASVESAVKLCDYDTAKTELLAYYRTVQGSRVTSTAKAAANADIFLEAFVRNIYPTGFLNGDMINLFEVSTNQGWSQYSIDAKSTVSTAKGSYPSLSVMISSVDKYYTTAEIYSRESEAYAPKLVVTANDKNGVSRTLEITADRDGMIVAGTAADTVYNGETVMQVQEHGTYQDYDNTTKRAYIAFDISDLSSSDTITSAYIQLYARSYIPNNESAFVTIPKELSCYWYHDSSWAEDSLCWNTFSDQLWFSCNDMEAWDYITSNTPSVKGKVCGYHRGVEPTKMSDTYSYYHANDNDTEAEKYAYNFLRQEMALINSVGLNSSVMNALDMSRHLESLSEAVLRVIDSSYMSPEIFTAIMKYQWQLADYLTNSYYGKATNNWATFATGGVYSTYARFPEYASHETWEEKTRTENERVCFENEEYGGSLAFEDGLCVELSHNYTSTLLSTFYTPISVQRVTGEPLPYSDRTMNMLESILEAWALSCGPYFGGFNMGDAYDTYTSYKSTFNNWYKYVFPNNPIIEYVATGGTSGELPSNATTNFPSGLRTYMRSDWGQNSLQMSMTGKLVGSHGHKDALSVTMFAYGKYLLTDPGYGALLTGNTLNKMISPNYHNLVTVNSGEKGTMDSVDSTQLNFKSNADYDFVEYSSTASTTAPLMQRSVTFAKDSKFWIITDYDVPNDTSISNDFYQHWHLYPESNPTFDAETKILRTNFTDEPNVQVVPVGTDSLTAYFEDTLYSEKSGQFINTKQGIYKLSKSGNGIFSTIIVPENTDENIVVSNVTKISTDRTDETENAFSFTMDRDGETSKYYYYHINDETLKGDKSLGEYSTDASTALIQETVDGTLVSVYLLNTTYLNKGTEAIFASDTAVEDVSITYENQSVTIYSEGINFTGDMPFTVNTENCDNMLFNGTYAEFTTTVMNLNYADYTQLSDVPRLLYTASSTGTDTVSITDGMLRRYQDTTVPLNSAGNNNSATNPAARQKIAAIIETNPECGTTVEADALQGEFDVEITYTANAAQYNSSYYTLSLGNNKTTSLFGRIYPSYVKWLNASSSTTNTLSPNTSYVSNLEGLQHIVNINVNTTDGYVSLQVNDSDFVEGTFAAPSVGMFSLLSMQRAPVGAWIGINSIKITQREPYYSDGALAVINSLPQTLVSDINNVNADFTVPVIDGVTWSSDNSAVTIDETGCVTVPDTECDATITASFAVTLSDSDTINYEKNYAIHVVTAE